MRALLGRKVPGRDADRLLRKRTTINFTLQAYRTLQGLCASTGESMTEVVQAALKLYRWYNEVRASGGRIYVENSDGERREVISI